MSALSNPKTKLQLAAALVAALLLTSSAAGLSASVVAQVVLGLSLLGGAGWWLRRKAGPIAGTGASRRLRVLDRAGLSPRCALAIVCVDDVEYLVAFGDGFAELTRTQHTPRLAAQGRRPAPRRRRAASGGTR